MSRSLYILLIVFIFVGKIKVSSSCSSMTLLAHTYSYILTYSNYENNRDCTFTIRPSSPYNSSNNYYLEIKWLSFDVEGDMPDCSYDYVEVFVTSSDRSIGKYCSDNLQSSSLFNMYSYDGHAKIKFHSDSSTRRNGFRFSYVLKSKSSAYLGSSSQTYCSSSVSSSSSGNKYSEGWPYSYAQSSDTCIERVHVGSDYKARVAFMDIDTYFTDYVQLQGSYSGFSNIAYSISNQMFSVTHIQAYTVQSYDYFIIKFIRQTGGATNNNRGFVSGYVIYGSKSPTLSPNIYTKNSVPYAIIIIVSSTVGVVIFVVVLVLVICKCKKRNVNNAAVGQNPNRSTIHLATTSTMVGNPTTAAHPNATTFQTAPPAAKPAIYPPTSQVNIPEQVQPEAACLPPPAYS